MLAFTLTVEQLKIFYTICEAVKADTEEKKMLILQEMARMGQIKNIVKTSMDRKEYTEYLTKHFGNVLEIKSENKNG